MHQITKNFIDAIFNNEKIETATVYKNGQEFATYSKNIAVEVARDIGGIAIDDETGEVLES